MRSAERRSSSHQAASAGTALRLDNRESDFPHAFLTHSLSLIFSPVPVMRSAIILRLIRPLRLGPLLSLGSILPSGHPEASGNRIKVLTQRALGVRAPASTLDKSAEHVALTWALECTKHEANWRGARLSAERGRKRAASVHSHESCAPDTAEAPSQQAHLQFTFPLIAALPAYLTSISTCPSAEGTSEPRSGSSQQPRAKEKLSLGANRAVASPGPQQQRAVTMDSAGEPGSTPASLLSLPNELLFE